MRFWGPARLPPPPTTHRVLLVNTLASPIACKQHETDAADAVLQPGASIVVDLATYVTDLNAIKSDGSLAVSLATTFLSLAPNTITDMAADLIYASNPAARVTALAADKFVSDTTAPLLRSFDYTSSSGLLELHFDEPMDYATDRKSVV